MLLGALLAGCGSDQATAEDAAAEDICKPGAGEWMDAVLTEPILTAPEGSSDVRLSAVESCESLPLIGHIGPPEQFSATLDFRSRESDEQVITGLRLATGLNGWTDATSDEALGCMFKVIEGASSFLSIEALPGRDYRVSIFRGDPASCRVAPADAQDEL